MNHESIHGIRSPGDLWRACVRHRWKAGAFILLTLAATAAIIFWYPRAYRSEAQLFVRVGRESVSLDPTATTGQVVQVLDSREREINSTVEMLRSRALAEEVVDRLGPAAILSGKRQAGRKQETTLVSLFRGVVAQVGAWAASIDPVNQRERAISKIGDSLQIESPRTTSIIRVRYFDDGPQRAREVVDALLDAYAKEHVRAHRIEGSQSFFEEQVQIMEQKWQDAVEELRATKNALGLVSIEVQRGLLEKEMSRLESELISSQISLAATEARIKELNRLKRETPARSVIAEETGFSNDALDAMRQSLYELEIRERELLTRYSEQHPHVIAIRDQVAQSRDILSDQEERRSRSTTAPNPAREQLELDLNAAQASASSLRAEEAQLIEALAAVRKKIEVLNDNQVLISKLEQDAELAHRNYLAHSEKLEQARIDGALQQDRISNVNVVQPASLEAKPVSPRKGLVAAAGLAIAFCGSLVIVLLGEQFDRSLRTEDEVEQRLDLPVLAALPRTTARSVAPAAN